jgi:predicted molibdopterin-dependent oxidoreductase YjgC
MPDAPFRVTTHPQLGPLPAAETVEIIVDGAPLAARAGEPVAAALLAHGRRVCHTTVRTGEPRGVFCAIGLCGDCAMQVDGIPGVLTCVTPVRDGMDVRTQAGLGTWQPEETS